ncbi:hypothetical protein PtA15_4A854 [Puccinia triticina]|uniref:Uncharacterized protein n=1 Tax=Puccinia triticina TaxID=208348 RepID=A0ABY7CJU5_9BASI|nr:uncharacterized protein PtA15_4A854 [Puccinia triticina]WAQ84401.1 hypothetical protein PtA15_4A854 [Puccinia triticina]
MTTMATCPRTRPTHICEWLALGLQDSQTPGYLFLNEVPPLRIKKTTLANHPPPLHSPKQKGKAPTHSRATSHHRRADDQQQHSDRAQRAIESNPAEFGIGSAEQDLKAPIDIFKSPQHAWYFVRRLVGLELRWEAARAWKLTNLNSNSVDTPPCKESSNHHSRVRSNDDQSSYSWDSSSGETTVAAENLPILTYLIQNFLLALPIIWDTVSVIPNVPHSSHLNPQAPANHTSVAVYWTAGVLSILRRLHQSNLSAVIDLGSPGFLHILFDSHIARLIERSVATSLKLCTQTPCRWPRAALPLGPHHHARCSAPLNQWPMVPAAQSSPLRTKGPKDSSDRRCPH